jgi:hypothetical protein
MQEDMKAFCGIPATLFCQNLHNEKIIEFGDRIIRALKGK